MNFSKWLRFTMLVLVLVVTGFAGAASARDKVLRLPTNGRLTTAPMSPIRVS